MKRLLSCLIMLLLASCATAPRPEASGAAEAFWPAGGVFPGQGHVSSWKDFKNHNAARRAIFASRRVKDQDGLVFVGDSITEGWHTLDQDFADLGVKIVNRGIGGDTTPNLLYRLNADVLALHPRGLVILIGTNDLGEHTAPTTIAANLRELLARIRASAPSIPIAWCLVMPRGADDHYAQTIPELNQLIQQLARTDPNVTICDTYTPLAQPDGTSIPQDFNPDRLHLNPTGYQVWRKVLHPIVADWKLDRESSGASMTRP